MQLAEFTAYLGTLPKWAVFLLTAWLLAWKGLALWKSARKSSPIWFVVMLVLNTLGLLEILYIFVFSKMNFDHLSAKHEEKPKAKKKK